MNKAIVSLVIFNVTCFQCFSQSSDREETPLFEDLSVIEQVDSLINKAAQEGLSSDSKLAILELALSISKENDYKVGKSVVALELAIQQVDYHMYEEALKNVELVIESSDDENINERVMLAYKYGGTAYNKLGDKVASLGQYEKSLYIANELKLVEDIVKIKNNIGIIYLEQENYDQAIEYFKSGLNPNISPVIQVALLENLGFTEMERSNYAESLKYYETALSIAKPMGDEELMIDLIERLGALAYHSKDFDRSLSYAIMSINTYEKLDALKEEDLTTQVGLMGAYSLAAVSYTGLEDYWKARGYYKKTMTLCNELGTKKEFALIYGYMASNEELGGDYKQAYYNLKIHNQYNDSLFSIEKNKQIEEVLAKYEAEKKEKEIAILETEQIIQQTNISNQKTIKNITLGVSGLIVLVLVLLVFSFAQRLRNKEQLVEQQELINTQKIGQLIRDNEINTIKANIKGQEEEKSRIAKDLHDGVAGTLAAIKMKLANMDEKLSFVAVQNAVKEIDEVYIEVRDLSHNLTPHKVTQAPFINLIQNYIDGLTQGSQLEFNLIAEGGLDIMDMNEKRKIDLYRVIQELIMNVFKHADASFAELQVIQVEKTLNVMLEDDGVGFDITKKVKGIGLNNVRSRVELLKGEMYVDSVVGRGTIINIDVPLEKLDQVEVI